jgi:uncharacterized protein YecT (DUF1311 family)
MILLALALIAQEVTAEDCRDPQTQVEMNMCAMRDFEIADRALNIAYREAVAGARADDASIDRQYDQRPTSEEKLREAQRAWITFRDAHCTYQGYGEARGGSMEPMSYEVCRTELTRARTAQLRGDPAAAQ